MKLDEWIISSDVGISSKTIWACLKDIELSENYGDIPYDVSDFKRCYNLIKKCNVNLIDLKIVSKKLPYWKPYIDNWENLTKMYKNNINNDYKVMYNFMKKLEKESNSIRY